MGYVVAAFGKHIINAIDFHHRHVFYPIQVINGVLGIALPVNTVRGRGVTKEFGGFRIVFVARVPKMVGIPFAQNVAPLANFFVPCFFTRSFKNGFLGMDFKINDFGGKLGTSLTEVKTRKNKEQFFFHDESARNEVLKNLYTPK